MNRLLLILLALGLLALAILFPVPGREADAAPAAPEPHVPFIQGIEPANAQPSDIAADWFIAPMRF